MADELRKLAPNVWIFPHDKDTKKIQPAVGVICTATQTVLVDGGNSPAHARRIQAALRTIDAPPVGHVIYTHHHWDHVFGACALEAPTIGHVLCRERLLQYAAQPWSRAYLHEAIRANPLLKVSYAALDRAIDDWSQFRVVAPDTTFSQHMRLDLDGLTIELDHIGGWHAADSIVVRVPQRRVIFLGDCFYPALPQDGAGRQGTNWAMLASLFDRSVDVYVHGHAFPLRRSAWLFWTVRMLARIRRSK
jgi:glyoxylase-like metal-dependent hydrolase (beta-lactamase superfamily II)